MDIETYLEGEPRGAGVALAKALGVHPVMVSQWSNGVKPVPVERCADIERATGGKVTRRDLRPADWHRHWPELVTDAHPAHERETAHGA